jgi:hypothetical protein
MTYRLSLFTFAAIPVLALSQPKATLKEFTVKKTAAYQGSHALYQDVVIPANANVVLAPTGAAGGHVKVFSGRTDMANVQGLLAGWVKTAKPEQSRQTSIVVEMMAPTSPASPAGGQSQNNLKQLGLGVHNILIGLLRKGSDGKLHEFATYMLLNARIDKLPRSTGASRPTESFSINFGGVKAAHYIGSANGGVWKTTDSGKS